MAKKKSRQQQSKTEVPVQTSHQIDALDIPGSLLDALGNDEAIRLVGEKQLILDSIRELPENLRSFEQTGLADPIRFQEQYVSGVTAIIVHDRLLSEGQIEEGGSLADIEAVVESLSPADCDILFGDLKDRLIEQSRVRAALQLQQRFGKTKALSSELKRNPDLASQLTTIFGVEGEAHQIAQAVFNPIERRYPLVERNTLSESARNRVELLDIVKDEKLGNPRGVNNWLAHSILYGIAVNPDPRAYAQEVCKMVNYVTYDQIQQVTNTFAAISSGEYKLLDIDQVSSFLGSRLLVERISPEAVYDLLTQFFSTVYGRDPDQLVKASKGGFSMYKRISGGITAARSDIVNRAEVKDISIPLLDIFLYEAFDLNKDQLDRDKVIEIAGPVGYDDTISPMINLKYYFTDCILRRKGLTEEVMGRLSKIMTEMIFEHGFKLSAYKTELTYPEGMNSWYSLLRAIHAGILTQMPEGSTVTDPYIRFSYAVHLFIKNFYSITPTQGFSSNDEKYSMTPESVFAQKLRNVQRHRAREIPLLPIESEPDLFMRTLTLATLNAQAVDASQLLEDEEQIGSRDRVVEALFGSASEIKTLLDLYPERWITWPALRQIQLAQAVVASEKRAEHVMPPHYEERKGVRVRVPPARYTKVSQQQMTTILDYQLNSMGEFAFTPNGLSESVLEEFRRYIELDYNGTPMIALYMGNPVARSSLHALFTRAKNYPYCEMSLSGRIPSYEETMSIVRSFAGTELSEAEVEAIAKDVLSRFLYISVGSISSMQVLAESVVIQSAVSDHMVGGAWTENSVLQPLLEGTALLVPLPREKVSQLLKAAAKRWETVHQSPGYLSSVAFIEERDRIGDQLAALMPIVSKAYLYDQILSREFEQLKLDFDGVSDDRIYTIFAPLFPGLNRPTLIAMGKRILQNPATSNLYLSLELRRGEGSLSIQRLNQITEVTNRLSALISQISELPMLMVNAPRVLDGAQIGSRNTPYMLGDGLINSLRKAVVDLDRLINQLEESEIQSTLTATLNCPSLNEIREQIAGLPGRFQGVRNLYTKTRGQASGTASQLLTMWEDILNSGLLNRHDLYYLDDLYGAYQAEVGALSLKDDSLHNLRNHDLFRPINELDQMSAARWIQTLHNRVNLNEYNLLDALSREEGSANLLQRAIEDQHSFTQLMDLMSTVNKKLQLIQEQLAMLVASEIEVAEEVRAAEALLEPEQELEEGTDRRRKLSKRRKNKAQREARMGGGRLDDWE